MKKMNNKGFSLVELIIVIAIMAVLIGVLAPQFMRYVESARQSTDMDNVNSMKSAVEAYVADELVTAGTIKIEVTGSGAEVKPTGIAGTTTTIADYCDELGISTSGKLTFKSGGWGSQDFTYDTASFKWTGADCKNTKKPEKNMYDVFK